MLIRKKEDLSGIHQELSAIGAAIPDRIDYDLSSSELNELQQVYPSLPQDTYGTGARRRVYCRLMYSVATGEFCLADDQSYSQTYEANDMNGGEVRSFAPVPPALLESGPLRKIITSQLSLMSQLYDFERSVLKMGLHLVRYEAEKGIPTYSSPIFFHKDDEPIVFLTVVSKSENLVGGDTLLARDLRSIDRSVSLGELETAILSKNTAHMVTPMESSDAEHSAWRDIILLAVEESDDVVRLKPSQQ